MSDLTLDNVGSQLQLTPNETLQLFSTVISGSDTANQTIFVHPENTTQAVGDEYTDQLQVFNEIFNLVDDPNTTANEVLVQLQSANFDTQMADSIDALKELALHGFPDSGVAGDTSVPSHLLSLEMGQALDQLFRTLTAAGVQINWGGNATVTLENVLTWKNLSVSSNVIAEALAKATQVGGEVNRNLQALTELVYVKTGNEIMVGALTDLEEALSITKDVLETLNSLQALHNNITTQDRGSFTPASAGGSTSGFQVDLFGDRVTNDPELGSDPKALNRELPDKADAFFGRPIEPIIQTPLTDTDVANFLKLQEEIQDQITDLTAVTGQNEENSLLDTLKAVAADMKKALDETGSEMSAVEQWILDSYSAKSARLSAKISTRNIGDDLVPILVSAEVPVFVPIQISTNSAGERFYFDSDANKFFRFLGKPGDIQQGITEALSAGEALNDTQKEETRRFLFVFEEYYKSAAAILNKLTQLIEKMAQGISR